MKSLKDILLETKGEHDKSKVYDDLYSDVEKDLKRWGAGPVYGYKGDQGICFSVSKGKNVKKDDWIVIEYNERHDDLTIYLCQYGDAENAKEVREMVYAGQEPMVIDELLGL